jgi:predicted nucleic acid-binding protein
VIVADTGALVALLDSDETHHLEVKAVYDHDPDAWILPWAILPEVDHLLLRRVGPNAAEAFRADVAEGRWAVQWDGQNDMARAHELNRRYRTLKLGLVDGVVMSVAERLKAEAIATLDLRHFAAVRIAGNPRLLPRDA